MTADDLYSKGHVPDPVTEDAVAAAMAATAPSKKSLAERAATFVLVFIGLLLSSLIVLGVFNAINTNATSHKQATQQTELAKQNDELAKQNACLTSLVQNFLVDQQSRTIIAADDRNAVRDLIKEITQAKNVAQKFKAIDHFNARSKENDARRSHLPIVLPKCEGIKTSSAKLPPTVLVPKVGRAAKHKSPKQHATPGGVGGRASAHAPAPSSHFSQSVRTSHQGPGPAPPTPRPHPTPSPAPRPVVSLPRVCIGTVCVL